MNALAEFVKCESGVTAIEYGLIAALIGVSIIGALQATGSELGATFGSVTAGLQSRNR